MVKKMEDTNSSKPIMMETNNEDDDFSIVSHPSSPENDEGEHFSHLEHVNFHFQSGLTESQVATESIHKQLQELLKENNELRDAMHKNNLTMRQQFASLSDWRDQTLKAHERHKQMIEEAYLKSQQLQEIREELSNSNEKLQQELEEQKRQQIKLQQDLSKALENYAKKEEELVPLREEMERQHVAALHMENQLKELQFEVCHFKEENERLAAENKTLSSLLEQQKETLEQTRATNLQTKSEYEAIKLALNEQLEKEKQFVQNAEILESAERQNRIVTTTSKTHIPQVRPIYLTSEEEGFSVIHHSGSPPQNHLQEFQRRIQEEENRTCELNRIVMEQKAQLEEYETQFAESRKQSSVQEALIAEQYLRTQELHSFATTPKFFEAYEERCQTVGQELEACQARLEILNLSQHSSSVDVQELKLQVEHLNNILQEERKTKAEDRKCLEQALQEQAKNYQRLVATFELYESEQQSKGRQSEALTAISQKQHQEQLDEFIAKIMTLELKMQDKEAEIDQLKSRLGLLQMESEQVPILRAQVELYQQDYTTEQELRQQTEAEVNRRKQEVNTLKAKLMQLTSEITQQTQRPLSEMASTSQQQHEQRLTTPDVEVFRMPLTKHSRHRRSRKLSPGTNHQNSETEEPFTDLFDEVRTMTFECPKCHLAFSTVTAVENHLDRCLNENAPYP